MTVNNSHGCHCMVPQPTYHSHIIIIRDWGRGGGGGVLETASFDSATIEAPGSRDVMSCATPHPFLLNKVCLNQL